jgi:hypothetical protein
MRRLAIALHLLFSISFLGSAASHAGWIENGVLVTQQWDAGGEKVTVAYGYSGVIIAYLALQLKRLDRDTFNGKDIRPEA